MKQTCVAYYIHDFIPFLENKIVIFAIVQT